MSLKACVELVAQALKVDLNNCVSNSKYAVPVELFCVFCENVTN
jgi:hypothetical protein